MTGSGLVYDSDEDGGGDAVRAVYVRAVEWGACKSKYGSAESMQKEKSGRGCRRLQVGYVVGCRICMRGRSGYILYI